MNNLSQSMMGESKQYFQISSPDVSEICLKMKNDMAYLRDNMEIISEEDEKKILPDLEMFLTNDIAREIKISLYDPLQNNRVFIEYCYKLGSLYSSPVDKNSYQPADLFNIPETCLFDVFVYFTKWFTLLAPEEQKELLRDRHIEWFNLNFNLEYNQSCHPGKIKNAVPNRKLSSGGSLFDSSSKKRVKSKENFLSANKKGGGRLEEELRLALVKGEKLNYIVYCDLESAVESIISLLRQHNKIPIQWNLSRGFLPDVSSDTNLTDINRIYNTKEPDSAINFVVENEEERVSYVFEDFHHYIGSASVVNTDAARIRSLLRELSRSLKTRDEYVFLLSPTDSLPMELTPLFNIIKQETKRTPSLLNRYGLNLTDTVMQRKYKPLIGRNQKTKRIIQVLCQMETNNPLLVGEPGVGKTALIEGLASEIVKGNVPSLLQERSIFSLNMNALVAGSRYRGDFEERINGLIEEVKSYAGKLIVFIDEIHTLLGAGSAEGASGAEDILKPALARGDFPCIGATTYEGYRSLIKDPALARRFQKIDIPASGPDESVEILMGVSSVFEEHHNIKITVEAIKSAVKLSEEYMQDQFLPGKAVSLLDSTSVFVKMEGRDTVYGRDIEEEIKRINEDN